MGHGFDALFTPNKTVKMLYRLGIYLKRIRVAGIYGYACYSAVRNGKKGS